MRESKYFPFFCAAGGLAIIVAIGALGASTLYESFTTGGLAHRGKVVTMENDSATFIRLIAMSVVAVAAGILAAVRGPMLLFRWWKRNHPR